MSRDAQRAALGHSKPAVEPAVQDAEVGWLPSREVPGKECSNQGRQGARAVIYAVMSTVVGVDLTRPRLAPYAGSGQLYSAIVARLKASRNLEFLGGFRVSLAQFHHHLTNLLSSAARLFKHKQLNLKISQTITPAVPEAANLRFGVSGRPPSAAR